MGGTLSTYRTHTHKGESHHSGQSVRKGQHSVGLGCTSKRAAVDDEEEEDDEYEEEDDLSVSFGYHCRPLCVALEELSLPPGSLSDTTPTSEPGSSFGDNSLGAFRKTRRNSSFSSLAGAALSANTTLSNTTLANASIPNLDSPRMFRPLGSASSSSSQSTSSTGLPSSGSSYCSGQASSPSPPLPFAPVGSYSRGRATGGGFATWQPPPPMSFPQSSSAPTLAQSGSWLHATDVQMAGGAAGEDRCQAVCSEENGWLFCGVYDGFNGRDAADYLAANLYENVAMQLRLLEWRLEHEITSSTAGQGTQGDLVVSHGRELNGKLGMKEREGEQGARLGVLGRVDGNRAELSSRSSRLRSELDASKAGCRSDECCKSPTSSSGRFSDAGEELDPAEELFRRSVVKGLMRALAQSESDFLDAVEEEMEERPELAMVGSCVLAALMQGQDLYTMNLGDSRALLATRATEASPRGCCEGGCRAVQLTEDHKVEVERERLRVMQEHPDDSNVIWGGRVKGKLAVTRAFGAGYLKKTKMNEALMGILRVSDLDSPPYVSTRPYVKVHRVQPHDRFVVLGSDGLFDFLDNDQVVACVCNFMQEHPHGDPAKHLLEVLLQKAANSAGLTVEQLKSVPYGRRRKYHDDVTVIVIMLGESMPRTTSASTVA